MIIKIDVKLTNGDEDSCIVDSNEAGVIVDTFLSNGVLQIGTMGEFISFYPAASVFSFNAYKWED